MPPNKFSPKFFEKLPHIYSRHKPGRVSWRTLDLHQLFFTSFYSIGRSDKRYRSAATAHRSRSWRPMSRIRPSVSWRPHGPNFTENCISCALYSVFGGGGGWVGDETLLYVDLYSKISIWLKIKYKSSYPGKIGHIAPDDVEQSDERHHLKNAP